MVEINLSIGESVRIGNVKVTLAEIYGHRQVKLGFTAPRSVPIYRQEVVERIQQQKAQEEPS